MNKIYPQTNNTDIDYNPLNRRFTHPIMPGFWEDVMEDHASELTENTAWESLYDDEDEEGLEKDTPQNPDYVEFLKKTEGDEF